MEIVSSMTTSTSLLIGKICRHTGSKTTKLQSNKILARTFFAPSTSITPLNNNESKRQSSPFIFSSLHGTNHFSLRKMSTSQHAVVNHKSAYEESMTGRHGKQLALAYKEGADKDKEDIDYFKLMEEAEDNLMNNAAIHEEESEISMEEEVNNDNEEDIVEEGDYNDYFDDEDDENEKEQYNNDGSISSRSESELIALRSGAPAGGSFAIIQLEGFQHKVAVDDVIITNKLKPVSLWKVGRTFTIKSNGEIKTIGEENIEDGDEDVDDDGHPSTGVGDVLMVANSDKTYVGLPAVKGAEVDVMVEEITRDKTIIIFKKRRRKNSKRKNGFRREVTFLRVLDIRMPKDNEE